MSIEKTLNPMPAGLAAADAPEEEIFVEVVPDGEGLGEAEEVPAPAPAATAHADNLYDVLDATPEGKMFLAQLAGDISQYVLDDETTRADWVETYVNGLQLMGLKYEERTKPWSGASGVSHPVITEAVVKFQSEMMIETFPAAGPAKEKILGKETAEKKERAARVVTEMNYQLTEGIPEFRLEHERMLFNLPAVGCTFKKVYDLPQKRRPTSVFVPAEDILMPYGASNAMTATRLTHIIREDQTWWEAAAADGLYREDVDYSPSARQSEEVQEAKNKQTGFTDINDTRTVGYETQLLLQLPGLDDETGPRPYIVTVLRDSNEVVSIYRNWDEADDTYERLQHIVQYDYVPGFGPYGYGLFHLIGGYARGATSMLRQLIDAGTLANLPGGFKTRGLRVKGDDTPIEPGEFRDVDLVSGALKDNIVPLPYKEPSATLFELLKAVVEEARQFANTADMKIADMSAQTPVGTMLALLERQLKTISAVQARTHNSLKLEMAIIKRLIAERVIDRGYKYDPDTGTREDRKRDFESTDVIPVSDPNATTMAQRVVMAQAVHQLSQTAPQLYNMPVLHRRLLEIFGFKAAKEVLPLPEEMQPRDPVTENMDILRSKPVKAFVHQDHEAHIRVHTAAMQDPMMAQLLGQNPQAQAMMAAAQAHIAEHLAYAYRQRVEARLGLALPPEQEVLPVEVEAAMSTLMAQAAGQVLQASQAQAAAAAAQAAANDPLTQMQQRELDIKERGVAVQEQKVQIDAADKADKNEIARNRLAVDAAARADEMAASREQGVRDHLNQLQQPAADDNREKP